MRSALATFAAIVLMLATATPGGAQVGEIAFANSGAPDAQAGFLAGLAQLHNFEYASAADLFRGAQQIDPGFAMAYWGEAMTYNHAVWMEQDLSAARKALARLAPTRAGRAATAKTAREKDYLRAVEVLYGEGGKHARDIAYADVMAEIHRAYPDDADASAFYALSLLGTAHAGRDFTIYMRAASIVEPVFHDHPNHPGAAHYLIHAYDDPVHAPLGLRAARAYSKIAPSAAHAQHMTSHIFVALGLWDDVVTANEAGVRITDNGRRGRGLAPSACGHQNFWLEYGYLQQRRFASAKTLVANCYAAARRIPAAPGASGGQVLDPDNTPVGSFAAMRLRYLLDTEEWASDVAGWVIETNGQLRPQIAFEFGTGYAAARSGRRADAVAALDRLARARRALDAALTKPAERDELQTREWARILEGQLSALIQASEGTNAGAADALRALSSAEDRLPYEFGPPAIDKPSYELLGETLLAWNRAAEARTAFEQALTRTPERTAALQGLMLAAARSGDEEKAAQIRARLQSIWHLADQPGAGK